MNGVGINGGALALTDLTIVLPYACRRGVRALSWERNNRLNNQKGEQLINAMLRKKLIMSACLCVALITGGCTSLKLKYKTAPAPEPKQKVYQSVNSAKLGNASFAVDYFGKDIETNAVFVLLYPQAAVWTPRGYNTTGWLSTQVMAGQQSTGSIGLVIPKKSECANGLLEAKAGQTAIHMWGTVYKAKFPSVGSVVIVDKCKTNKLQSPAMSGYPVSPR